MSVYLLSIPRDHASHEMAAEETARSRGGRGHVEQAALWRWIQRRQGAEQKLRRRHNSRHTLQQRLQEEKRRYPLPPNAFVEQAVSSGLQ